MSNMVTRCPQCQTSFKVTEEHLKIANGAVRCGSCLLVFQARQHWVNSENMAKPAAAPANKFQFDQSAVAGGTAAAFSEKPAAKEFVLPTPPPPIAEAAHHKKLEEIGDDDKISDDLDLDIEDDEPKITPKKLVTDSFGDPDDDYASVFDEFDEQDGAAFGEALDENFIDVDSLADDDTVSSRDADSSDDAWAKEMLAEIEHEDDQEEIDLSKVDDVRSILTDFTNPVDVDAARRDLGFDQAEPFAAKELGSDRSAPASQDARAEMIAHIEPLPVELSSAAAVHKIDWKSILYWNAAAAGLVFLLAFQYVGFNFDKLAKSVSTRPYMQTVCNTLGCTLPAVETGRYIKIQNLVVRQHPDAPEALAVDAILFNVTDADLPFPKLELFFSDLAKTPVASRRFEPAEYLLGELSGQTQIPPGRPVHIAFEIINPGENALSWSLQVAGKLD